MKDVKGSAALSDVLTDRSFEDPAPVERLDLRGKLDASITVTPGAVRSGETVGVHLRLRNVSTRPLPLGFTAHSGPMIRMEVKGPGGFVDPPPPPAPLMRPGPPYAIALTLHPGAEIVHETTWKSVRREWDRREGVAPFPDGNGPFLEAGPLPPGRYEFRIQAMFHFEGGGLEPPVGVLDIVG